MSRPMQTCPDCRQQFTNLWPHRAIQHGKRRPDPSDAQRHEGGRCQWLDQNGKRCQRHATWSGHLHADHELIYAWVLVEACDSHAAILFKYSVTYQQEFMPTQRPT